MGEVFHGFTAEDGGSDEHYFFDDVAVVRFGVFQQGASRTDTEQPVEYDGEYKQVTHGTEDHAADTVEYAAVDFFKQHFQKTGDDTENFVDKEEYQSAGYRAADVITFHF